MSALLTRREAVRGLLAALVLFVAELVTPTRRRVRFLRSRKLPPGELYFNSPETERRFAERLLRDRDAYTAELRMYDNLVVQSVHEQPMRDLYAEPLRDGSIDEAFRELAAALSPEARTIFP
ncbi:MAG TPA: hypothetical protein VJ247_06000 [Gaiella sp.]|jgi:hypothetical protein|nr:hypothetical protein [Gaiella sp.]